MKTEQKNITSLVIKTGELRTGTSPVSYYDSSHQDTFHQHILEGSLGDCTIHTLSSVNGEHVPFRWLGIVETTAILIEQLREGGKPAPRSWNLMSPVHGSSTVNGSDIEEGIDQAQRLTQLANNYLREFHPEVMDHIGEVQLDLDEPDIGPHALLYGQVIGESIPWKIYEVLAKMARNHTMEMLDPDQIVGAYLDLHYHTYGRSVEPENPNSTKRNALFVVPQSEIRFIEYMDVCEEVLRNIVGINTVSFGEQRNAVLVANSLRTPHYYAHTGEPLLREIETHTDLPTPKSLNRIRGLNGYARVEIQDVMRLIQSAVTRAHDLTTGRILLAEMIRESMGSTV